MQLGKAFLCKKIYEVPPFSRLVIKLLKKPSGAYFIKYILERTFSNNPKGSIKNVAPDWPYCL